MMPDALPRMYAAPALQRAIRDTRLRGEPLRVYLALVALPVVDDRAWRYVKATGLATVLATPETTVREALATLIRHGYLEERRESAKRRAYRARWDPLAMQ